MKNWLKNKNISIGSTSSVLIYFLGLIVEKIFDKETSIVANIIRMYLSSFITIGLLVFWIYKFTSWYTELKNKNEDLQKQLEENNKADKLSPKTADYMEKNYIQPLKMEIEELKKRLK